MQRIKIEHPKSNATILVSRFTGNTDASEYHLMITGCAGSTAKTQLDNLIEAYSHALEYLRLNSDTAIFRRLFVSDMANNQVLVSDSRLYRQLETDGPVAVSVVEQPSTNGDHFALFAYHISDCGRRSKSRNGSNIVIHRNGIDHIWSTELTQHNGFNVWQSGDQTSEIFSRYENDLAQFNATLKDAVMRIWLFVQNVDNNYGGLVAARKALFEKRNMTANTHYIASTGIEGRHVHKEDAVLMDAYAISGFNSAHRRFLTADGNMGCTSAYGVTFERGVELRYRDRNHVIISGTASIDVAGNTLFIGDIENQTERAFLNIRSLLSDANATFADVAHLIIYLRDYGDHKVVHEYVSETYPDIPAVYVRAPVCRPEWLIEIECMAVAKASNPECMSY